LAIGANVAGGLFDLIRKSGGDKNLSEERVGIERNGREKVVELFGREVFVGSSLILIRNLILRLWRRLILLGGARGSRCGSEAWDAGETKSEYDGQSSRHESNVSFEAKPTKRSKEAVSRIAQQRRAAGSWPQGLG
jgi:hypothetical protein